MSPVAQRTIEADLDRLEAQRAGYARALASSSDERVRARHERTLARLDEEIDALQVALDAIAYAPAPRGHVDGVPIVERTTEMEPAEYDEVRPPRPRWIIPVAAIAAVTFGALLAWATLPDAPAPAPAPAPAKVIVSSPVPPDSTR